MNKENQINHICSACLTKKDDEHVCSSQSLSDSVATLSEMANEQLNILERFSLNSIHLKCEKELETWHSSAVHHLGQIFSQRLNELSRIYQDEFIPDLKQYQEKILCQLEKRIQPKMNQMINEKNINSKQIQSIQVLELFIQLEFSYLFFYFLFRIFYQK